jgi:hypothetical protein
MAHELLDAATAFERLRSAARSGRRLVGEVAREVLAGVPLPSSPAEGAYPTRELAVIAYQQAAGLHERLAALYEQLGHPDRARQEWQRGAGAGRARAGQPESADHPTELLTPGEPRRASRPGSPGIARWSPWSIGGRSPPGGRAGTARASYAAHTAVRANV